MVLFPTSTLHPRRTAKDAARDDQEAKGRGPHGAGGQAARHGNAHNAPGQTPANATSTEPDGDTQPDPLLNEPFVAGTGILGGLVPPIASPLLRQFAGHRDMEHYLIASDTWQMLLCRFMRERSRILEIGCGCGEIARGLVYHPHVVKYTGLDAFEPSIDWCRAAFLARDPQRFAFHHLVGWMEARNDEATEQVAAPVLSLPAADNAVDVIFSRGFLGHIDEARARQILKEILRALTFNGHFFAAIPQPSSAPATLDEPASAMADSNTAVTTETPAGLDPERFQQLAMEAGFELFQRMTLLGDHELFLFTRSFAHASTEVLDTHDANRESAGGESQETYSDPEAQVNSLSSRVLTPEMLRLNELAAAEQGVAAAVHPEDFIYWFCVTHPHRSLEGGIDYYFRDGAKSARKLLSLIDGFADLDDRPARLLEFASGYGCVSRHLKKERRTELVSCDIHAGALHFLEHQIGIRTMVSAHHPDEFATPEPFDVVFALSFFSHMPRRTFGLWLRALFNSLSRPGYLVFTTLGTRACQDMGITPDDIPTDGFWFQARSEQGDLDRAEYGMTIVTPAFVQNEVAAQTSSPIILYRPVGWWDNQDLWVVKREA